MKFYRLKYRLFWLLVAITSPFQAQNGHLRAFTVEDGLPQTQINTMIIDGKGYLWLGTHGRGLARFDGKDFIVIDDRQGLPSNYIFDIKASKDSLFVGTKAGLSIKYQNHIFNYEAPQVNQIRKFGIKTYLLTNKGLFNFSSLKGVEQVHIDSDLNGSDLTDMVFDGNYYWIGTRNGLWKCSELTSEAKTKDHLDFNEYISLNRFASTIYASTYKNGTLVIANDDFESSGLIGEPSRITTASIQNGDQLWIGTENEGIYVFDAQTGQLNDTLHHKNGLTSVSIRQILADRSSNLWIATSSGLNKYFQNSFKHFNIDSGLKGNRVYALHHQGSELYFSVSEKGLQSIDERGVHEIEIPDDYSGTRINTITSDQNGNLWLGSEGKGILVKDVSRIDLSHNDSIARMSRIFNSGNGFPFDQIRSIHTEADTIWAATDSNGIVKFRFDPTSDKVEIYKTYSKLDGIEDLSIQGMVKDDQGRFWYGTSKGHLGYLKGSEIIHKGQILGQDQPINTIVSHNNQLFIGTSGNGIWYSNDFNTFRKLSGSKSLPDSTIKQLIFDKDGYLWAGTEHGTCKIKLSQDMQIHDLFCFGINEGFPARQLVNRAVASDHNGNLWFGTMQGLVRYEPRETTSSTSKPIVFLEDLQIAFQSLDTLNLSMWPGSERVLKLKPDERQIRFSYRSIDLEHPNGIQYRFKLNEGNWSPWSDRNTQDFSELNFGAYEFIVQSRDHRWNQSEPLRFSFYIETPLLQKVWFQILLGVMVIIIVVWVGKRYVSIQRKKDQQDKERLTLENHLLSLEQKALRLQMNPHFIFNVLNGIKAMAPNSPEKMNDTVNNFAALLRETLNNSREDTINLSQEIKTLKHYIEVEQLMAEQRFEYTIQVDTEVDPEEILIPPMLVQPFVENAIRHGILESPREGILELQFKTEKDLLKVSVSDNGIGIRETQKQQTSDHKSMALKVTKERLASVSSDHDLKLVELKNENGEVCGTRVSFNIPLKTDF